MRAENGCKVPRSSIYQILALLKTSMIPNIVLYPLSDDLTRVSGFACSSTRRSTRSSWEPPSKSMGSPLTLTSPSTSQLRAEAGRVSTATLDGCSPLSRHATTQIQIIASMPQVAAPSPHPRAQGLLAGAHVHVCASSGKCSNAHGR